MFQLPMNEEGFSVAIFQNKLDPSQKSQVLRHCVIHAFPKKAKSDKHCFLFHDKKHTDETSVKQIRPYLVTFRYLCAKSFPR